MDNRARSHAANLKKLVAKFGEVCDPKVEFDCERVLTWVQEVGAATFALAKEVAEYLKAVSELKNRPGCKEAYKKFVARFGLIGNVLTTLGELMKFGKEISNIRHLREVERAREAVVSKLNGGTFGGLPNDVKDRVPSRAFDIPTPKNGDYRKHHNTMRELALYPKLLGGIKGLGQLVAADKAIDRRLAVRRGTMERYSWSKEVLRYTNRLSGQAEDLQEKLTKLEGAIKQLDDFSSRNVASNELLAKMKREAKRAATQLSLSTAVLCSKN